MHAVFTDIKRFSGRISKRPPRFPNDFDHILGKFSLKYLSVSL
jgi:hypothetical protein